jgi:hypothetical protein
MREMCNTCMASEKGGDEKKREKPGMMLQLGWLFQPDE